jgi:hypothetical protein
MAKVVGTVLVLLAGLGLSTVQAGFRSPESLVRNVYAYYGDQSSDLSSGLPRDPATAPVLRSGFAERMEFPEGSTIRFSRPKPDMQAWRRLDINPSQTIRQDLRRRRFQQ